MDAANCGSRSGSKGSASEAEGDGDGGADDRRLLPFTVPFSTAPGALWYTCSCSWFPSPGRPPRPEDSRRQLRPCLVARLLR